jgi:hypothetical protein
MQALAAGLRRRFAMSGKERLCFNERILHPYLFIYLFKNSLSAEKGTRNHKG